MIFDFIARKKYRTIGLVARIMPIAYIFCSHLHYCVHFLSIFYTPILPQSEVIVKWYFFRSCGRIFRWFAFLLSPVEFCRNFPEYKFQHMPCILFHIMLLLSYIFCMCAMQVRYFFNVRVRCRASVALGKVRTNYDRKQEG